MTSLLNQGGPSSEIQSKGLQRGHTLQTHNQAPAMGYRSPSAGACNGTSRPGTGTNMSRSSSRITSGNEWIEIAFGYSADGTKVSVHSGVGITGFGIEIGNRHVLVPVPVSPNPVHESWIEYWCIG
jgi:hypothetical protein